MPNYYRNNYYLPPQKNQNIYPHTRTSNISNIPPPPPPCPPKKKKTPPKKKFNFKSFKKDTCASLNDVECFLNKFSDFIRYVRIINLLK